MAQWLPFWPASSADSAGIVDLLYVSELLICSAVLFLVFGLMGLFCIRYRRGSAAIRSAQVKKTWVWEIGWTAATLIAFLALFVWGADVYAYLYEPPPSNLEIYVVGKQWMWKIQHPGGQREIDTLHVPVGETVRLVLASEDVIHSFYIPAFRVKHDVVPGTYETFWFKASKPGDFRLECAEFCGTQHAHMGGHVIVMTPADYAEWLTRQGVSGSLAEQGEALFRTYGCSGCHGTHSSVHAPPLAGLYGGVVRLQNGRTVIADKRYIRDSILLPASQVVAGYEPLMPSFAGQINEEDLSKIIAYIQSLASAKENR